MNNVNVLDLLLGQGKQDLTQGQGYHQRKLSQIYPDRTGYQQTGFKNVQVCVPLFASSETLTAPFPAVCHLPVLAGCSYALACYTAVCCSWHIFSHRRRALTAGCSWGVLRGSSRLAR